jgi:DNA modification methylase
VTSPPYWGLRDYGVEGQIGLEPTPEAYVERLVEVFREVRRVLRDDGTLWLNLGDSYNGSGGAGGDYASGGLKAGQPKYPGRRISALKPKDLVGIPWRVAFALQEDGWYLRSDVIWSKSNPMPESVTDRPTRSHEYVFLLSKQSRYFYDADAVRVPYKESTLKRARCANNGNRRKDGGSAQWQRGLNPGRQDAWNSKVSGGVSAGRNLRTVWEIPTQPTPEAHFATFPEALVKPCIMAGTSERGACPECGAPWRRVVEVTVYDTRPGTNTKYNGGGLASGSRNTTRKMSMRSEIGWAPTCTCSAGDPIPCTVLDPFGGSGTVAKVARDLGRSSILIEINPEYVQIAKKRLRIGEQLDSGVCEYVVKSFLTEATP